MHLDKALYGIRQLPRAWNSKIDETLAMIGFSHNTSEHTVYTRGESASWLLVGVYVNDANKIATFKQQMSDRFKMSDLGLLSFYLGIEVKQGSDGITLSQAAYAWKILECAGMGSSNPCHTPMEHRLKMSKQSTASEVNATEYPWPHRLSTVPGAHPARHHVHRRLCQSLHGVPHHGAFQCGEACPALDSRNAQLRLSLPACGKELRLLGYSDANMGGDIDTRKSMTGTMFYLGSSPVTWQ
jgi:hypothetical protein